MYIEENPASADLDAESGIYSHLTREKCIRLHFFGARIEDRSEIRSNSDSYCGYCDIRSDGTIARCNISRQVIIRPDTYAYLVCQITEAIEIPTGTFEKPSSEKVSVTGFSHVEKNRRGLMCSQAAVANVVHYWNARRPGSFSKTTAVDISKAAGVSEEELRKGDFEGLSYEDVNNFFVQQGFHCFTVAYRREQQEQPPVVPTTSESVSLSIKDEDPGVTIYGFLESGFPVIVVVKTKKGKPHALTVVGHTFDKNIWLAYAEPYYFDEPLTGGGGYHSNIAWIRFFIVQDDNLGPYFFVPRVNLDSIIEAIIVPLPYAKVVVSPKHAERAAYKGLAEFANTTTAARVIGANSQWLEILKSHFDPNDAEGWVLRPYLRLKDQVIELFANHEFGPAVAQSLSQNPGTVFWVVELSWPNLYCYDESKVGEIVIDATNKEGPVSFIHLPGILVSPFEPKIVFAAREDPPRRSFQGSPK